MSHRSSWSSPDDLQAFQSESEESADCVIAVRDEPLADGGVCVVTDPITIVSPNAASEALALFEFASESATPTAVANDDVALAQYPSEEQSEEQHVTREVSPPIGTRWILPAAAAFVIGATSVLVVLHQRSATHDIVAPISTAQVSPPIAPHVHTGISSSVLRTLPTVQAQGLARATTGAVAPPGVAAESARSTTRIASALPSIPAAPSIDIASIPTVASAPPEGLTSAVESPAPITATSDAADEFAVRRALHSYEIAYEGLDVAATAEIWPTVDRRALSRAFAALKSQDLVFKACSITVYDANATAYCRGTLEYVRKVGNPAPLSAEQQWVFKMRRQDGAWKIDDVSASQSASTNGALQ